MMEMMDKKNAMAFEDIKVHVRFKLFALWSSVMFFYIYGDYFQLHEPGTLQEMIAGKTPFGAVSRSLTGDGRGYDNSESDAVSVARPAYKSESLGEYRVRRGIHRDHDSGDQGWLALLCPFRIDRNHSESPHRLVRLDVAEAANPLN